jgi:1-acyl-sn-glycerol-3-phosphate acyltransferase
MAAFRLLSRAYYRFRRLGPPLPADGPVILVANHVNGLLDPAAMLHFAERELVFLGKEPLLRMPFFGALFRAMEIVPVWRAQDGADTAQNAKTFAAVGEALAKGRVVVLFPEGKSHDEPGLQPLKTGAARMALGVDPALAGEVRIVPVGIVYERKKRFGSRATLLAHQPIDVGTFRTPDGPNDRAAVLALTARIEQALRSVTIDVAVHEDRRILELAERIWEPARGPERVERLAAFAQAASDLRQADPVRIEALRGRLAAFAACLRPLGATVDHLELRYDLGRVLGFAARIALELLLFVPFVVLGALWWGVPTLALHLIGRRAIEKPDLYGTYKALASLVLVPLWHVGACLVLWLALGRPWHALWVFAFAPPVGLFGLHAFRRQRWLWREAFVFLRFAVSGGLVEKLRRERSSLAAEIGALAALPRPAARAATRTSDLTSPHPT